MAFTSIGLDDVKTTEEGHRHHRQRCGADRLHRCAAVVPVGRRRAPRQAAGGSGADLRPARHRQLPRVQSDLGHVRAAARRHRRSGRTADGHPRGNRGCQGGAQRPRRRPAQNWAEHATPNVFANASRFYSRMRLANVHRPIANLVISNVPGPDFPLYLAGAELDAGFPLGPVMDGMGVNITVMSYRGVLYWGIVACPENDPDGVESGRRHSEGTRRAVGRRPNNRRRPTDRTPPWCQTAELKGRRQPPSKTLRSTPGSGPRTSGTRASRGSLRRSRRQ